MKTKIALTALALTLMSGYNFTPWRQRGHWWCPPNTTPAMKIACHWVKDVWPVRF